MLKVKNIYLDRETRYLKMALGIRLTHFVLWGSLMYKLLYFINTIYHMEIFEVALSPNMDKSNTLIQSPSYSNSLSSH